MEQKEKVGVCHRREGILGLGKGCIMYYSLCRSGCSHWLKSLSCCPHHRQLAQPAAPWVSRLPPTGALESRALTQCLCHPCQPLRAAQAALGACAARLGDRQRTSEGSQLRGELLKAPRHLCASRTWISSELSFKDWTQFLCLPPAINRVAESFVLLDSISSLLQTTVFTDSMWCALKLHICERGQELDAVSRSAT